MAPIKKDGKILDIGTGTGMFTQRHYISILCADNHIHYLPGVWAIDIGRRS